MRSKSTSERPSAPPEAETWVGERRGVASDSDREGGLDERDDVPGSGHAVAPGEGSAPVDAADAVAVPEAAEPEPEAIDEETIPIAGAHEIEIGRVIDGRYRVEALLGQGAVGLVFRCRHLVLGKDVAIKVLRPDFAGDREASERLVVEAKAASAIGSPHIVETIDFGQLLDGSAFFVMEYLDGQPLGDVLDGEASLDLDTALHIGIQIADALEAAHAAGIVHRDLKPDNVFLVSRHGDDRFVKILDFGIAKLARAESRLTRTGQVYGTPHYMSPEQASGRSTDTRTDVYALGVILYEMAAGTVPFDAEEPMGVLSRHLYDEPPELIAPEHAGLNAVIRRCLEKDPVERYQSMADLRRDLLRLRAGAQPEGGAVEEPALLLSRRAPPRQAAPSAAARGAYFLAAVGVVVSGTLAYALYRRADPAPPPVPVVEKPAPIPVAPPPSVEVPVPSGRPVMVIVIPPDARIRLGSRDLGPMPVTVYVPEGEKRHLAIRRDGYVSRRLTVDGSKSRVVVGLVPERKRGKKARTDESDEAEADKAAAESVDVDELVSGAEGAETSAAPAVTKGEASAKPTKGEAPAESDEADEPEPVPSPSDDSDDPL